ncbi:MAG: membrane protein insertase YidC, partial [Planctomycetes bacterium]|nr:membrane protein insertase YidC [Planctomycetota bacterium]
MNRETIIRWVLAAAICIALMLVFRYVEPHIPFLPRPAPQPPRQKPSGQPSPQPGEKQPGEKPPGEKPPAPPAVKAPALVAAGAAEAAPAAVLGSSLAESDFDVEAEVAAVGGAVRRLALARRHYFKTIQDQYLPADERAPMELVEPDAPFPAFLIPELRVRLKDADEWAKVDLGAPVWRVVEASPTQAVLALDVQDGEGKTVLAVRRTYKVLPRSAPDDAGAAAPPQYELRMKLEFAAADERAEKIAYVLQGPAALPAEAASRQPPAAIAGTWGPRGVQVAHAPGAEKAKGEALPATSNLAGAEVVWAGGMDKYFAVVLIPQKPSREGTFAAATETSWYRAAHERFDMALATVRLVSKEAALAPGKPVEHEFLIYAGPKDADLLETYYGNVGLEKLIVWASPCCFVDLPGLGYLSRLLAALLDAFYAVSRNYGVAIILLVLVLRVALHPVTRWSTRSMMEMQKLQPEMERIRKEFANDKERMQQEMAKIGGLKSLSGCLPMFIQMPIWIALYGALGAAIHLRHAPLLPASWLPQGSMFLQDLSAPDALVHWNTPVYLPGLDAPLLGWVLGAIQGMLAGSSHTGLTAFNLLPVLVGISFYLQQKITPQPAATTPQMEQQRKMMSV